MKCPFCGYLEDKVVDSRESREGDAIRRRRECLKCEHRFTTYEQIERDILMVIKRDGRREEFSKDKLLQGIHRACQKRPVSEQAMAELSEKIFQNIHDNYQGEVPGLAIGERVMEGLRDLDKVAYIRFASVYRRFEEAGEFVQEVKKLERRRDDPAQPRLFDFPNVKR